MRQRPMPFPECFGFIPARYASTRFPGKPLADILGRPMFWHVWSRAKECPLLRAVTLCTDDERIADAARALGVPCAMTRPDHAAGTDRIHEAALAANIPAHAVVVNIQGDEPALDPAMLEELLGPFADPSVQVATLALPIRGDEAASPDKVNVVVDTAGNALYFSRARIPWDREAGDCAQPYLLHIGLYAFRMETLARFVALPQSALELREKLEQLRFLENGIPVRVVQTDRQSRGVDRPEDIEAVLPFMRESAKEKPCPQ